MEDWTSFTKRIFIKKPLSEVYDCWATKKAIETWFLETADYTYGENIKRDPGERVREGDRFTWRWHNWDVTQEGQILKANGHDAVSFTFGIGGNVHVRLKEHDESTEVILTQDEIPTDDKSKKEIYTGCATGWTFWMANLKAYLEHGITLHEKGLGQDQVGNLVNS